MKINSIYNLDVFTVVDAYCNRRKRELDSVAPYKIVWQRQQTRVNEEEKYELLIYNQFYFY